MRFDVKLTKEQVDDLNALACKDFALARGILAGYNLALGTEYGWLNKRVVVFENPYVGTAEKYRHAHDAYVWARD